MAEESNVNLEDFISEVLKQIINGVKKSQNHAKENGASINPYSIHREPSGDLVFDPNTIYNRPTIQEIEFDVAVTTSSQGNLKGGMGIFIQAVGIGYQAQKETGNSTVNRIKFTVPIVLPQQDK